jgi:hypothetical protein
MTPPAPVIRTHLRLAGTATDHETAAFCYPLAVFCPRAANCPPAGGSGVIYNNRQPLDCRFKISKVIEFEPMAVHHPVQYICSRQSVFIGWHENSDLVPEDIPVAGEFEGSLQQFVCIHRAGCIIQINHDVGIPMEISNLRELPHQRK